MSDLPKRKNIRLKYYDYSQNGAYFITICTENKSHLFGEIVPSSVGATCGRPLLSNIGIIVRSEIEKIPSVYSNVDIDNYVIMPNHIHMIMSLCSNGRPQVAPTISRIVKQFKGSITKKIGHSIWQRSYHDHVIRNEAEYQKIWEYIDTNPMKWEYDCYFN